MKRFLLPALLALLLGGCVGREPPAPSPLPSAAQTAAPIPTPSPSPAPTAQPEALRRTLCAFANGADVPYINNESDDALLRLWPEAPLTVTSTDGPMEQLYIKWDNPPGEWTLHCNGQDYTFGAGGVLHEYVPLPESCQELSITVHDTWHYVCAVCAFSQGALPAWVQRWEVSEEAADILVVSTHNDDDILFFGGLEPTYAGELGYEVQVVYLTNHWTERERGHETLNGLYTMGVRRYPVIGGFGDVASMSLYEARQDYDEHYVIQYLVEHIRRFRPRVIVGQDENGEYGHGVHQLCVAALKTAVEAAADAAQFPDSAARYGLWDTPKTYLHLYGTAETRTIIDWDVPLSAFGGLSGFQVAQQAYACHVSQHPDKRFYVFPRHDPYTCYEFGLWRSLVGPDEARNDLFEHLPVD